MKILQAAATAALMLFSSLIVRAAIASPADSGYTSPDLDATTAAPWNPPAKVTAARPWESALRFPGRVISLPLVGLGLAAERGMIYVEDTHLDQNITRILLRREEWGVDLLPASLGEGTGLGAEFRLTPVPLHRHLTAAVSASTHQYNRERISGTLGWLGATWQNDWRSGEPFFGLGMDRPHSDESNYGVQIQSAYLTLDTAAPLGPTRVASGSPAPNDPLLPHARISRTRFHAWAGPRQALMTTGRTSDLPSVEELHPGDAAGSLHHRLEHFVYGAGLQRDSRYGTPHWATGWRASAEVERRDQAIDGLLFAGARDDARSFTRITARAEAGTSFGRDPRTLRLAVKAIDQRLDRGDGVFLLDDLSSLGGSDLAGFENGRFRDVDLMVARLSYIYPLLKNVELDLHSESGQVCPSFQAAKLANLEQSFGVAMRLRLDTSMLASVGLDWSREMARVRFAIGGVE